MRLKPKVKKIGHVLLLLNHKIMDAPILLREIFS